MALLEVCVADAESLAAAIAGGADRIELCSALELGGLTPGPGLIALAAKSAVPVQAMVRPRAGDFVFTPADIDAMRADIAAIRAAGLAGVVLGASLPDGRLDRATLALLAADSKGLSMTLHRAIDLVPDWREAIEIAVELGFDRILTSGGTPTAPAGRATIARALELAAGRIAIMAGAGITSGNVAALRYGLPLNEIHASCSVAVPTEGEGVIRLGFAGPILRRTDTQIVAALKRAIA